MLAKILSLAVAAPADTPPTRQQLREALRTLADASQAWEEARAATERARNVVREGWAAEEKLKDAEAAAEAAAAQWAADGASDPMPPAVQAAMAAAETARSRANQARLASKGAASALAPKRWIAPEDRRGGEMLERERAALVRRDQAREAVDAAVRVVLDFELVAPAVARVEKKRAELEEALLELLPLAACGIPLPIAQLTNFQIALQQNSSAQVASQEPFAAFRARLLTDADAVFSREELAGLRG